MVATSPDTSLSTSQTLYGDANYNGGYRPGLDIEVGAWLDCCHTEAITYDFLYAGRQSSPFFASSDGDPILCRPFTDANTGDPTCQLVAFPGVVVGNVSVDNHNSLWGTGVDWRHNLCCCCECNDCCNCDCCFHPQNCHRLDFVAGFRFYGFDDNLTIQENLTSIESPSPIPVGTQIQVTDSFITKNNFYGGEIGFVGRPITAAGCTNGRPNWRWVKRNSSSTSTASPSSASRANPRRSIEAVCSRYPATSATTSATSLPRSQNWPSASVTA